MNFCTPNYRRYGPGYGFKDAPETYICALCGKGIDWPAEEIDRDDNNDICHKKCLEELWETA